MGADARGQQAVLRWWEAVHFRLLVVVERRRLAVTEWFWQFRKDRNP